MDEIDQVIHIDWELVSLHKQCMNLSLIHI